MKCQLLWNVIRSSMVASIMIGGVVEAQDMKIGCHPHVKTIDHAEQTIEALISHDQDALVKFREFWSKLVGATQKFLDREDFQPISKHIEHMDANIRMLETDILHNPQFIHAHPIITDLHRQLIELSKLLKTHVGSRNFLNLGLQLKRFNHLLPRSIRDKGWLYLGGCLNHRLACA